MQKLIYTIISICFLSLTLHAQKELTQLEKLKITAKVWGFLKYYHPNVANGTYDWDQQLFDILPKIDSAKTNTELSAVFLDWLNALGQVERCKVCNRLKREYFDGNLDLSWIDDDSIFSKELSAKLRYIEENRFQKQHYYVTYDRQGQKIKIINERLYEEDAYPSIHIRLLNLFRYWNIIEYFYAYKYLLDEDWDEVLQEMVVDFVEAKDEKEFKSAIKKLVAKIDDSHTSINVDKTNSERKRLPFLVTSINDSCIISGYYDKEKALSSELKLGDVILKINNVNIESLINNKDRDLVPASNELGKLKYVYYELLSNSDEEISLEVYRKGEKLNIKSRLYQRDSLNYFFDSKNNDGFSIIEDGIGYLNMRYFPIYKDETKELDKINVLKNELNSRPKKGLIIDIRGYPRWTFYQISELLNSEKRKFVKFLYPHLRYPGRFFWDYKSTGKHNKKAYRGKVVILVDDQSLSRSEFAAMCLSTADDAVVIGSQTAGADGDVSAFNFASGYETTISGLGVYYPDGTQTQRVGVKIDIEVKPTIKGLQEDRDEVLEKAIEIINNNS